MDRPSPRAPVDRARDIVLAVDAVEDAGHVLEVRLRHGLGVNAVDFDVLRWVDRVHRRGGVSRVGDIARTFGVSSGSATEIVHRLTRAGLLARTGHPTDARVRRVVPTELTRERMDALIGAVRADLDALLDTVTADEERRIVELLAAVREILTAERARAH